MLLLWRILILSACSFVYIYFIFIYYFTINPGQGCNKKFEFFSFKQDNESVIMYILILMKQCRCLKVHSIQDLEHCVLISDWAAL